MLLKGWMTTLFGGGTTPAAGSTATTFTSTGATPLLQYHIPGGSSLVTASGTHPQLGSYNYATSVSDTRNTQAAVNALGTGPLVMSDSLNRKFLRFTTQTGGTGADHGGPNGPNLLQIPSVSLASRGISVFMVGRHHRAATSCFFSLGLAGSTPPNPGGPILGVQPANSGSSPFVRSGSRYSNAPLSGDASRMLIGSQLQVIGAASRTVVAGANGGTRMYVNTDAIMHSQLTSVTATGATIGSYAPSPGLTDFFDLYEMVIFTGDLTDAQADAISAALVSNWSIPSVTDQLVLDGDSITAGIVNGGDATATNGVLEGWNVSMILTDPGAGLIPASCRLINQGVSGATTADLITRKDAANSVFTTGKLASGRNIIGFQIGRNSWTATTSTGTDQYQQISGTGTYTATGLIKNTALTGYLDRGWEVVAGINIATGSVQPANDVQRAAMRASSFLTDCSAGPGQTYDGKLTRIDLAAITVSGVTKFSTAANASDTTIYQADSTHPNAYGTRLMATGGDTPLNGWGAVI